MEHIGYPHPEGFQAHTTGPDDTTGTTTTTFSYPPPVNDAPVAGTGGLPRVP